MTFSKLTLTVAACALLAPAANAENMSMKRGMTDHSMMQHQGMMHRDAMMPQKMSTAAMMGEGKIASITATVDMGEIKLAKLALQKSRNEGVRGYAQHMISDHQDMMARGKQLYSSLNIKPINNPTSTMLKNEVNGTFSMLQKTSGKTFDMKYLEANAKMHNKVGNLIEAKLIPSARNSEVRSELASTLRTVRGHEQDAKSMLSNMDMTHSM